MTARPRKRCTRPYCANPATYPSPLCARHRAELDATYTRHRDIYDSPEWIALSRETIALRPVCEHCRNAPSAHTDHITALTNGGAPHDPNNVQALCTRCHARKTAHEVQLGHAVPAKIRPRPAPPARRRRPRPTQ